MRRRSSLLLAGALTLTAACGDRRIGAGGDARGGPRDMAIFVPDGVPDAPAGGNHACAAARPVTFVAGLAVVTDSTAGRPDEYPGQVRCGLPEPARGPQLYYRLTLKAGKSYLFTLQPSFDRATFYVFRACGAANVERACASKGASGIVGPVIPAGRSGSRGFKPATTGSYIVAVDGLAPGAGGAFKLTIREFTAPDNPTCAWAKTLTLTGGKVSVRGSTVGAGNEYGTAVNCGLRTATMAGPQVYYKVRLSASRSYRVSLVPQFPGAHFYIFRARCDVAAINGDCGSNGATGTVSLPTLPGRETTRVFSPPASGDYVIAVDATLPGVQGAFALTVETIQRFDNGTCARARALTLVPGKVITEKGTTAGGTNEFGSQIRCGGRFPFLGPQAYYKVKLTAGRFYKFALKPSFLARLYIFGDTCDGATINADCASRGARGAYTSPSIQPGTTRTLAFQPRRSGTYKLAVDSISTRYAGAFTLTAQEIVPAANGTCARALRLTLGSGKLTVKGDTSGVKNEFGSAITCTSLFGSAGPQVYYKVGLTAGKAYRFRLTPEFTARLYVFGDTCSQTAIQRDCASRGRSGDYVAGFGGRTATLVFTPGRSGTYTVAVDSASSSAYGAFTLEIDEAPVPPNSACGRAQPVKLAAGTTTITGDTTYARNEHGTAVNCGDPGSVMRAGQLYYKVSLVGGHAYRFILTPDYSFARLYLFRAASCGRGWTAINGDCGSKGRTGVVSGTAPRGRPIEVAFKPAASGDYILAVDGTSDSSFGRGTFTLAIK